MTRYAIIIGVEEYRNFPPTPFTHADSRSLYSTLTERCDYTVQHALLLNLAPDADKKPIDILSEIRQAVEGSDTGDTILFYFAGHGHYLDGKTYLILPSTIPGAYETTALALDDISKELRPPQRACLRIFDACHSGLDVRSNSTEPDSQSFVRAVTHDPSGWVTLAACREDEYSVSDSQIGHGVFTYYLCEYIRGLKPDERVLPELLKVGVVEKVFEHAKRLGYTQTPTFNASVSGNISLAIRRADTPQEQPSSVSANIKSDLAMRITELRKVADISGEDYLKKTLELLIEACKEEFDRENDLGSLVTVGPHISADAIPKEMHPGVVDFIRQSGFQPRHELMRREEVDEYPLSSLSSLLLKPKIKNVSYSIWQPNNLPNSAAILELPGDGRCVPSVKVLLYVVPLQLTTCLLVSSFRHNWPPRESNLELLCHSHQILKPGRPVEEAKSLAPVAVKRTMDKSRQHVARRVEQLEKELQ